MALIESKPENSLGNLHQISLRPSFDACFQQDNIWDVMEQEIHSMDKQLCDAIMSTWIKTFDDVSSTF